LDLNDTMELKLTGSVRYDKSEFFDGFFSPRLSAGLTVNRDHNIRASVQTGFRNPTTQDLFIGLDAGRAVLIGSAPTNLDRYSRTYDVSTEGQMDVSNGGAGQPSTLIQTGRAAYENSYSASSVEAFALSGNTNDLKIGNSAIVKPEQVTSAEVGYRGKLNKVIADVSVYY